MKNRLYYEWKRKFKNDWNNFPIKRIKLFRMYELFDFDQEWYNANKFFLDSYSLSQPPTAKELKTVASIFYVSTEDITVWLSQT